MQHHNPQLTRTERRVAALERRVPGNQLLYGIKLAQAYLRLGQERAGLQRYAEALEAYVKSAFALCGICLLVTMPDNDLATLCRDAAEACTDSMEAIGGGQPLRESEAYALGVGRLIRGRLFFEMAKCPWMSPVTAPTAVEEMRAGIEFLEQQEWNDETRWRSAVAQGQLALGERLCALRDTASGTEAIQKGIAIADGLPQEERLTIDCERARGHIECGEVLHQQERYDEAVSAYGKAVELLEAADVHDLSRLYVLAKGYSCRSRSSMMLKNQDDAALRDADRSLAILQGPIVRKALGKFAPLSTAYYRRGLVLSCLKRHKEAKTAFKRSHAIDKMRVNATLCSHDSILRRK